MIKSFGSKKSDWQTISMQIEAAETELNVVGLSFVAFAWRSVHYQSSYAQASYSEKKEYVVFLKRK